MSIPSSRSTHDGCESGSDTSLRMALVCAAILVFSFQTAHAQNCNSTPVTKGYRDFNFGSTVYSSPTAEKPEHKLWYTDDFWWGSLWDPSANKYRIHRFDRDTQCWTSVGPDIDDRPQSLADALWEDEKLYIASHVSELTSASGNGRLYRYSYNESANTYSLDAGFPVEVTNGESETLTITKEGNNGRLWVTWVAGSKVMVNHSTTDDLHWATPFQLPVQGSNVGSDDISAIVKMNSKVGVLWSNQSDKKMYFAVHKNVDAPGTWQTRETALSDGSKPVADDHINLKLHADDEGNMYAVTKSSTSSSSETLIYLLKRDDNGNWSSHEVAKKSDNHTRPILALDAQNRMIHVFMARLSGNPRCIYRKSTSMSNIQFASGLGEEFIRSESDDMVNNPTSTRQNLNSKTGILILASDENTHNYLHGYMPIPGSSSNQSPIANAAATPQSGAAPLQVSFSSAGSYDPDGGIASYSWNFGDGSSSSSANPSHTYNAAGNYNVVLIAADGQGATGNSTVAITVTAPGNQPPIAKATATPQNGTAPLQVNFSSSGSNDPDGGIASYAWNFGDGSSSFSANPSHTYNTAGNYSAVLTVTDNQGANNSASVNISVSPVSGGGGIVTFNPTDDAHVNSSSPSKNYGDLNTFRIRSGSPTYLCYLKFNVTGLSGPAARATLRLYVTDDGPDAGTLYSVANNYKSTSTPWNESELNWNNAPAITGTPLSSPGNAPSNTWVEYDVTAAISGNGIFSFGLNPNTTNSVYFSTKEGDHTPQLIIEGSSSGGSNQSPIANASANPQNGTAPLAVNFSSSGSNDPDGSIASYSWNFGDGNSSYSANPSHTYNTAGNYSAELTVTDNEGATGTTNVAITVTAASNQAPVALASANPQIGTAPLQVNFSSAGSNDPDGSIASYSWNFGDGNSSTQANPSHTYNAAGNYNAALLVTDNLGATGVANVAITVTAPGNQPPIANASATPQSGTVPLQVSFNSAGSNDPDGSIASYFWDFGDGGSSSSANPIHTYNAAGVYEAVLTVTDNQGANSSVALNISAVPNSGSGETLSFNPTDDAHVNSSNTTKSYGDLNVFRIRSGSPTYLCYVKFNVTGLSASISRATLRLYVTDDGPDAGTLYSVSNNYKNTNTPWNESGLHWNNAPALTGTPLDSPGSAPLNAWVEYDVTAAITGNGIFSFALNANTTNSVYFSTKEGDHAPQLVVESSSSLVGPENTPPLAIASATPQVGEAPLFVDFSSSGSHDPDGSIVAYLWDFGDGETASEANPSHLYYNFGNYNATLTVTDDQGVSSIASVSVNAAPAPDEEVTMAFNPTDDAHINSSNPSKNYGASEAFRIRAGDPGFVCYLKFNVTGFPGQVVRAILRLYVLENGPDAGTLYAVSNNYSDESMPWTEGGLNWDNAPAITGSSLSSPGRAPLNTWVEFDVTPAITGNGTFSFGLTANSANSVFFSPKEGEHPPQLVLTNSSASGASLQSSTTPQNSMARDLSLSDMNNSGDLSDVKMESTILPDEIALAQNYPNPFNPSTNIAFALTEEARVTLRVYNMLGAKVATLVNGVRKAGRHSVVFDASRLPTGPYYYILQVGETRLARRLSFVK